MKPAQANPRSTAQRGGRAGPGSSRPAPAGAWAALPPDLQAALQTSARPRELKRGQAAWHSGDQARVFTAVAEGLLKVVRTASDGRESIIGLFGPGDSLGDTAVLSISTYPADAIVASRQALIWQSPAAPILAAASQKAEWASALRQPLLRHSEILMQKIEVASAGPVPHRLAILLMVLATRFGAAEGPSRARLPLRLSRNELAALIGARTETTIRILRQWEQTGAVAQGRDGWLLDLAGLRAIAGE